MSSLKASGLKSSSGARLYAQGHSVRCELGDGRVVKWAAMAPAAVEAELGVPANWHALDTRQKSGVIVEASQRAEVRQKSGVIVVASQRACSVRRS